MTTETLPPLTEAPQDKQYLLDLLPDQGAWSEDEYLWLSGRTNRLIEFVDGRIEVVPMPSEKHQAMLIQLFLTLLAFVRALGGKVFVSPLRLRVGAHNFREPDILLLLSADDPRRANDYWSGADLVVEIVSPNDRKRDLVTKRAEYAAAGIPEYWIVDPQTDSVIVLHLDGEIYAEHGIFKRGQQATSVLLEGFAVSVDEVLNAE